MMSETAVGLPVATRGSAQYEGLPVWVPPWATHVTAIMSGRQEWTRVGVGQTVVDVIIEINRDGQWRVLAGGTTDAQVKYNDDGSVLNETTLYTRLPQQRIPAPQIRGVLRCASLCTIGVEFVFNDRPLPRVKRQEHHSVTYDSDGEAGGTGLASVTIGSFTVANNANRCLMVGVVTRDTVEADAVVSSITHNSSTSGWVSVISVPHPSEAGRTSQIHRKLAPSAVASTVLVTMAGTCSELGAHAMSVYDVDQTTPIGTAVSVTHRVDSLTLTTLDVTAAANDLVYDVVYLYDDSGSPTVTGTAGAGQTERANLVIATYGGARALLLTSTEAGAATVTMSWAITGQGDTWCIQAACPIKAAAAVAGHPAIRRHGGIRYGPRQLMRGVY